MRGKWKILILLAPLAGVTALVLAACGTVLLQSLGYVPAFGWEMGPPTDKQLAALERLGIFPDEIGSAGKAAKLLDRLGKRRLEGLTTPKQIRFLENKGFLHVGTWQFEDARKLIDRIAGNGWRVPLGITPAQYAPGGMNA